MMYRIAAALLLCAGLVACNQNGVPATQNFVGQGDVKVLEAHLVPTGESSASVATSSAGYVIARIEFTNDLGYDTTPDASHFYLIDRSGIRYQGHDSGSSVFTGVSNSQDVLKKDDKRVYIVGFRANDPSIAGTIIYDR